jgi:hypothetical protein
VNPASGSPDESAVTPPDLAERCPLPATVYLAIGLPDGTMPGGLAKIQLALAAAARRMSESGHPVRYLNGMYMPAETRLLCVFAGESEETVRATVRLIDLPFVQIKAITDPGPA